MHGLDEYDSEARWYYPAIMRTTTIDPLAEKYYSISPYAWCANNPVLMVDPDGRAFETAWDLYSLATGAKSFVNNVRQGNVGAAILDGVGVIADAAAVVVPGVPGGVGAGIKAVRAADNLVDAVQAGKTTEKLRESAKTGQEAHRQIQKELKKQGADIEVPMKLKDGTKVRKDAVNPDGTAVIIKPNTPSGQKSAKARENLMKKNDKKTETILYDPKNPAYQPGSPTYIGPKKKN